MVQTAAARQAEYKEQLRDWEEDVEEWKPSGGANLAYLKTFHRGRLMMYLHYREAVGSGGLLIPSAQRHISMS